MGGSDSVGKTDSYCVSEMVTVVVKPAGIWELKAIVAQLKYRPFAANTAPLVSVNCTIRAVWSFCINWLTFIIGSKTRIASGAGEMLPLGAIR